MNDISKQVDTIFAKWDTPTTPGCILGIVHHGEIVYSRGYGMANLEYSIPNTADTVFDVGSVSKQFTAACVLLAAEQGKLSLDDDVRKFIPELPDYGQTITLRHLIQHTSGLRDYLDGFLLAGLDCPSVTDAYEQITHHKELNFITGEQYSYCNSGYFLLAQVIQRATGKTLRQFANELIFQPLGMTHTFFHDDYPEIIRNRATGHTPHPNGGYGISVFPSEAVVGAGGLQSTLNDLLIWERNYYNNRLGSRGAAFIQDMLKSGALNNGETTYYGLGLSVFQYRGLFVCQHAGAIAGYCAHFLTFPDKEFSVICLANTNDVALNEMVRKVADLYLVDEYPEPASATVSLSDEQRKAVCGHYLNLSIPMVVHVIEYEGKMFADLSGCTDMLTPTSSVDFSGTGLLFGIHFHMDSAYLEITPEAGQRIILERFEPTHPTPEMLAAYAGTYYSPELKAERTFVLRENILGVETRMGNSPFSPLKLDMFQVANVVICFEPANNGKSAGCRISTGWTRRVLFERK